MRSIDIIDISAILKHQHSITMPFLSFFVLVIGMLLPLTFAGSSAQAVLRTLDNAPVLHFTLARRGGEFTATEYGRDLVNLTYLVEELDKAEARFNLTRREVKGNKLVRKAKLNELGGREKGALMGSVTGGGIWCILFQLQPEVQR